jgi:hypothetical protein
MDLVCGHKGEGLSEDELRAVVKAFDVRTNLL